MSANSVTGHNITLSADLGLQGYYLLAPHYILNTHTLREIIEEDPSQRRGAHVEPSVREHKGYKKSLVCVPCPRERPLGINFKSRCQS